MGGSTTVRSLVKDFERKLKKDFTVSKVLIFGSVSHETADQESDVDLLIVSEDFKNMDFFERAARMYDYWDSVMPVDFLCHTPEEYEKRRNQVSIVKEASETGIEV